MGTIERRALQIAVALAALVPIGAGLVGMIEGAEAFGGAGDRALDGHMRYLSGLLLALGLAAWSTIPAIERRTAMVRMLTAAVVVGGLARLYGAWRLGAFGGTMRFALAMELGVMPLLCLWQGRMASAGRAKSVKRSEDQLTARTTPGEIILSPYSRSGSRAAATGR